MYRIESDSNTLASMLHQAAGLRVETQEAFHEDVRQVLGTEYFQEDPAVAGLGLDAAVQTKLYPVVGEQIYPADPEVWQKAVVIFAATVAVAAGREFPEQKETIEHFMGNSASHLLALTRPGTEVFVTPNAGISITGDVLGTRAHREQFLFDYSAKLNELDPPQSFTFHESEYDNRAAAD